MKQLIEGNSILKVIPSDGHATGRPPVVHLQNSLTLDDGNFYQYPTLILGSAGSGKSTLMRQLAKPIFENAKTNDNVITFCAKSDMLEFAYPDDIIINISNTKNTKACWNIFEEMKASSDPELTLREISTALFEDAEEKSSQPFFPQAAREIFFKTALYMYKYAISKKISLSNGDLIEFLETTPIHGSDSDPGWVELASLYPDSFGMLRDYLGDGSDQGLGCLSEVRTMLSKAFFGSFKSYGGTFSAIRSSQSGGKRIFLDYNYSSGGHATLPVYKILIDLFLKEAMRTDAKHKTWFLLDEGALLPKSNVLTDALSFGRDPSSGNKNAGVRILMALQSARQMTNHYTQSQAECILSLFPNIIAMRIADSFSRKIVSDRYGKAHYLYTYSGVGGKEHIHESTEEVVSDFHFSYITKEGQAIMSLPAFSSHPFIYDGYRKE